jgi:hypothetical protein
MAYQPKSKVMACNAMHAHCAVPGITLRMDAASIATLLKEYHLSLLLSPRSRLTSQSPRSRLATPCVCPAVPGTT